jgi:hypothetical protein
MRLLFAPPQANPPFCDGDHIEIATMSLACGHHTLGMEANVANGITQLVIGVALAGAIGGSIAFTPMHKPNEDVAFLERVASTVERAQVIPPESREYLSKLTSRHQSPLASAQLDLRRQGALERIMRVSEPDGKGATRRP